VRADELDTLYRLAAKLAPTLRFAPGEAYFPTIPFFPAFDTVQNPAGTWSGAVLDTIANLRSDGSLSWNTLDSAYARRQTSSRLSEGPSDSVPVPMTTAVFFRARCLDPDAAQRVWQFLQNDAQAWMRARGLRDLYYRHGFHRHVFQVVEYYFYYVNDTGLQGHQNDIESAFVFLPRARTDAVLLPSEIARLNDLVVIVGQGHSASTPNNVLVLTGHEARHVGDQPWDLMVELGGHSSAPDRNHDGHFSPGFDANWNLHENMWGTRDVQAVSGTGYLGRYESWMTLPRSYRYSVTLHSDATNLDRLLEAVPRSSPAGVPAGPVPAATPSGADARQRTDPGYLLIPVDLLRRLYSALGPVPEVDSVPVPASIRTTVAQLINGPLATLLRPWGFKGLEPGLDITATDAILRRMVAWTRRPSWQLPGGGRRNFFMSILLGKSRRDLTTERIHLWETRVARQSPDRILKAELFRPSVTLPSRPGKPIGFSLRRFGYWAWALDLTPGGGKALEGGILLPYFAPLRLADRSLDIPGIFEYKAALYTAGLSLGAVRPGLSVTYDRHYKSFFSWFLKYGWVYHRDDIEPGAGSGALTVGGTIMPLFPFADHRWVQPFANHLRVRAGLRLETRSSRPLARRVDLELSYYVR
jgi:hypothetical protein